MSGSIQFQSFVELLRTAVQDPGFVRGNTLLQNAAFMAQIQARINALNPDMNVVLDVDDVLTTSGSIVADPLHNRVVYTPAGFQVKLSNVDATVFTPARCWVRTETDGSTPADGVRYLVADEVKGVLLLLEDMTVKSLFPGLGQQAGSGYADATSVLTFTVSSVEYVAIAMADHHIVRIYNYTSGAMVATIGTLDTPGATGTLLNRPSDLAWDSTTSRLYISCTAGQPVGATQAYGFVTRFTMTTPASPVLVDIYLKYVSNGSLANMECNVPQGLFFDADKLWVTNGGVAEVGSLDLTTNQCSYFLGSASIPGYPFGSLGSVRVKTVGSVKTLVLANGAYGNVLSIALATSTLASVISFTAQESHLIQYGEYGAVRFASPDRLTVDGLPVDVFVTGDPTNHQVLKVNEQVYGTPSYCTFRELTFTVPIRVLGYALAGNVPSDVVLVEYRFSSTSPWHTLDAVTNVPPTLTIQFRLTIQLPMGYPIDTWELFKITVIGEQA